MTSRDPTNPKPGVLDLLDLEGTVRFATYSRAGMISTDPAASLAYQARITRAFGEKRGWKLVGSYSDIAHTVGDRPGLRALMIKTKGEDGAFQAIIITHMDRLSRDTAILDRLRESLRKRGVEVCALSEWVGEILADIARLDAGRAGRTLRK